MSQFQSGILKKGFGSRFVVFQGKRLKNHVARIPLKWLLFEKRGIVARKPPKPQKPLFCSFIKAVRFQTFIESPQLRLRIHSLQNPGRFLKNESPPRITHSFIKKPFSHDSLIGKAPSTDTKSSLLLDFWRGGTRLISPIRRVYKLEGPPVCWRAP